MTTGPHEQRNKGGRGAVRGGEEREGPTLIARARLTEGEEGREGEGVGADSMAPPVIERWRVGLRGEGQMGQKRS